MNDLVITGAGGFIGRHLLNHVAADGRRVRALTRTSPVAQLATPGIEWVVGDTHDAETWRKLVVPGCTVINLAHARDVQVDGACSAIRVMAEACAAANVARVVHCSTISVYGRTSDTLRTEMSHCNPIDDYGRLKLATEQALLASAGNRFELAVVRPAQVFGEGGQALVSLCASLLAGSRLANYCRSSLFGRRNMHLVPVDTVSAAIRFLCEVRRPLQGEIFLVSDDDDPCNNFRDVERILLETLQIPGYGLPRMPLPDWALGYLLRMRGRADINPRTEYRCDKLLRWGFRRPVALADALRRFAGVFRGSHGQGRAS